MEAPAWAPEAVETPGAAAADTRMDTVELLVHDLDAMTAFYRDAVTLDVLDQSGPTATLGRGIRPMVMLKQEKHLPGRDSYGAGLFHTAIVFEDQRRLAAALASMAENAGDLYQGAADHLVSEAFYFADPEGNGIELYRDRPRDQWQISGGVIQMASNPLSPRQYLTQWHDPDLPAGGTSAAIGHVHLQVGDIPTAQHFYTDIMGLDATFRMGRSALFVSAGGYHHHLGLNTWNSAGAGPRAATLGLGDVRMLTPTREDVEALAERLRHYQVPFADDGSTLRFEDPWKTQLMVSPEQAA
ncbi:VOC family protein [Nesterenkonia sphaerica]|uniref:VOC family protein n=1 Tax=Nesterenkonia sphaerica TaxID=1804988 RepID=A0A5R9A9V0_9MICC|nr:VOC family protein [Nesterenkonia sphaerica]TLP75290.1 VOC family protein [Nesterenkonia sphaerica]